MRFFRTGGLCGALALSALLGSTACTKHAAPGQSTSASSKPAVDAFGSLTVDQVDELIKQKAIHVYDNNTEDRYKVSHVPTAKWVPFDNLQAKDLPAEKDAKLAFYCANEH